MDASEVKRIINEHIQSLMRHIGVPHWRIEVEYASLPEDVVAELDFKNADYWRAGLTIDPAKCDSEAHVLNSLRHELLHVLAAPFVLYRNVMRAGLDPLGDEGEREDRLWNFAMEQQVVALERGLAYELTPTYPEEATHAHHPRPEDARAD